MKKNCIEDKVVEKKDKTVEEYDGIVIKTESASYDNIQKIL